MMKKKLVSKNKLTPKSILSRPRKEAFLPSDLAYIKNKSSIILGGMVGGGSVGDVYNIQDNPNLVAKVATGLVNKGVNDPMVKIARKELFNEWSKGDGYSANRQHLMIPTKAIPIKNRYTDEGKPVYALVRPKVTGIWKVKVTDSMIEQIRRKLISLTEDGFMFTDGLQIGLDRTGRPLVFDMGDVELAGSIQEAYFTNNAMWKLFLEEDLGKDTDQYLDLYGNKFRY
jgi:hypothetical protein